MGSETEDVEPSGAVWLDDHCNLGVGPVPGLQLLPNLARQEQARHTADYQTTPVWFLWQFPDGLLPCIFAKKGFGRWWQPRFGQCRCELEDKSGHWRTQCKDGKLSSFSGGDYIVV